MDCRPLSLSSVAHSNTNAARHESNGRFPLPFCTPQKLTGTVFGAAVCMQQGARNSGKPSPVVYAKAREIPGLLSIMLFTKNYPSARKVLIRQYFKSMTAIKKI